MKASRRQHSFGPHWHNLVEFLQFYQNITDFHGWLRLQTLGQLTDPLRDTLFTRTTTICETVEANRL